MLIKWLTKYTKLMMFMVILGVILCQQVNACPVAVIKVTLNNHGYIT